MWFYKIVFVYIMATGTVKGTNYSLNQTEDKWNNAHCRLATPTLVYNMSTGHWMVNEPLPDINQHQVWIGYINTTVALEYIGCTPLMEDQPTVVNSVGDCHFTCKGKAFAVQRSDVNIKCVCVNTTDNLSNKNCTRNCEQFLCGDTNTNFYAMYNRTTVTATRHVGKDQLCLDFAYKKNFTWSSCYNDNKRVLCRSAAQNAQHVAEVLPVTPESWSTANKLCFEKGKLPANINSIQNALITQLFKDSDDQKHWTGIQLAYTLQKADSSYNFDYPEDVAYGYLSSDGIVHFATRGNRRSLCQYSLSNTTIQTENETPEESSALAIGIGIAIGFIIIVAGAVAIVILHRRGILSCCLVKKTIKSSEINIIVTDTRDEQKTVEPVHNYFVLEKVNTKESDDGDPNLINWEDDNYNSIVEPDEAHTNFKVNNCDYDYTSNGTGIKTSYVGPENVYNRLQLDRHGDYDHVHGLSRGKCKEVGNDYDTAAGVVPIMHKSVLGVDSDYHHISGDFKYTQNGINASKVTPNIDYDVINGIKVIHPSADNAGYTHVIKKSCD